MDKFSFPKSKEPVESVIDPVASVNVPSIEAVSVTVRSSVDVICSADIVPVVVRFSFPKLIAPELSVTDPAPRARVPALTVVPFTVVVARVVIVADVCVPPTKPEVVGAVRVTTVVEELIPRVRVAPSPSRV